MSSRSIEHELYDLWWKNAVIYCLDVETYLDSNDDGVGDIHGLVERIDYLDALGVTCIWLMPFYPSPNRDDGYDVIDFYSVDPRLGDLGDFTEFVRAARERGIRVIVDLVVNHTSIEHPWFQASRQGPDSNYHDYYVWRDERPEDWETAVVFPGEQQENWTYDRKAGRYYLHHFYRHQPDLNPANPEVRRELRQIVSFWTQLGVSGFRVDAVPFLVETNTIEAQRELTPHELLTDLAGYLRRRQGDSILIGEVNLPPQQAVEYFAEGEELQMMFNFHVNQYLHLALVRRHADPIRKALQRLPAIPSVCQWANFLTNHDELTLDQLTEAERTEVFETLGPQEDMRLFDRGLRRRLPPMLADDTELIRLAYTVLFSLPGTPVLFYGEEIGMGENLDVPGRRAVRTPMQWTSSENAGFSTSGEPLTRPITTGGFGPKNVNVTDQARQSDSMLTWMQRLVNRRRETPEFGLGDWSLIDVGAPEVLAHRCDWGDTSVIALHNFSGHDLVVDLSDECQGRQAIEVWSDEPQSELEMSEVALSEYGYRWIRLMEPGAAPWI